MAALAPECGRRGEIDGALSAEEGNDLARELATEGVGEVRGPVEDDADADGRGPTRALPGRLQRQSSQERHTERRPTSRRVGLPSQGRKG